MIGDGDRPGPAPATRVADPVRLERVAQAFPVVDQIFSEFRRRVHAPGVAYGVVVDGGLAHAAGDGMADLEAARPAAPTTIFRIASMTKSVTAACCLALRDEGRLGLDDPVAAHMPEAAGIGLPTRDSAPLTVRQLLTMSAGFVTDDPWGDRQLAVAADDFGSFLQGGVPFNRPPGITYEYSNMGYALLGRVVSRVAGQPFSAVATEVVLRPLGMRDSHFAVDEVPPDRRARGYRFEDGAWAEEAPLGDGAFGPMGGLWTTIEDFARYVAFHLDAWPPRDAPETGPIRRSSAREMQQGQRLCPPGSEAAAAVPTAYGFGLLASLHPRDGRHVAHSGGLPGFGSRVLWLPDHGLGVIGFANVTYAPVHEPVAAAVDALVGTGALPPRPEPVSGVLLAAQAWVRGLYERWDDAEANRLAAENLFADRSAARRRDEMAALRAAHGAVVELGAPVAHGALRGGWRMACERGAITVTVSLAPTTPPTVQLLTLAPATS